MTIITCLWFEKDLKGALDRYTSLFPDSEVHSLQQMGGTGDEVWLADWRMNGTEFRAICQKAPFTLNESASLCVTCADQAEVDRYWDGLIAGGGEESQCGWLKDPWGLSWQIVPQRLNELMADPDPRRAQAAAAAMMQQRRIVIADLEAAADAAS